MPDAVAVAVIRFGYPSAPAESCPGAGSLAAVWRVLAAAVATGRALAARGAPALLRPVDVAAVGAGSLEGALDTREGPAFKPLPVAVRAAGLAGRRRADRVGPAGPRRCSGRRGAGVAAGPRRAGGGGGGGLAGAWLGGALAVAAVLLCGRFLALSAAGAETALVVAGALGGVAAWRAGRLGIALACAVACALLRVEAWPFLLAAGAVLWRRAPAFRRALALLAVVVPAAWLAPEWLGSGDPLRSGARARVPNPGQPALADVPFLASLRGALTLPPWPLWLGVAALAVGVRRGRDRGVAGDHAPCPPPGVGESRATGAASRSPGSAWRGCCSWPRWPRRASRARPATRCPARRWWACRRGRPRARRGPAPRAHAVALAAAALLAVPAAIRIGDLPELRSLQAYQQRLGDDLAGAVAAPAAATRSCAAGDPTSGRCAGRCWPIGSTSSRRRSSPTSRRARPAWPSAPRSYRARPSGRTCRPASPRSRGSGSGRSRATCLLGVPKLCPHAAKGRHRPARARAARRRRDRGRRPRRRGGGTGPRRVRPPEPARETGRAHHFDVRRIAGGLNRPTYVGVAPGDERGLWVLEQPGRVVRLAGGRRTTMLDLSGRVLTGAEQGLLGIAFDPYFATNRRLYLHWSNRRGDTRVAEFRARRSGVIDPRPVRRLLAVDQPEENHNGGQLAFGPDGRLYLGLGDGGGAFDPRATAQDLRSRLGKVIATPVDGPPRWRTVLSGLRNPWRFSFDAALGDLWIGDVGQDAVEEVNRVALEPDEPAKNLGWSAFEGTKRIAGHALDRGGRARVARGGLLARGRLLGDRRPDLRRRELPGLSRRYVYGDFCAGTLWSLKGTPEGGATDVRRERATSPSSCTSAWTRTASCCSPPAPAASTAPSRPARERARPRWPARPATRARGRRDATRGTRAGGERSRAPSASSSCSELVVAEERSLEHDRLGALVAHRRQPDGHRLRAGRTPRPAPCTPCPAGKRPSSQRTTPPSAVPGSTSASPRNSATQRLRRALVDLLGRARLLDAPRAQHGHGVGERERFLLVVGDEERARAGGAQDRRDLLAQALAQAGVERGERLVEQHDLGIGRQRAGERDALALAARELVRVRRGPVGEADEREALRRPRSRPDAPKPDVGGDREVREQRAVLEDHADVAALRLLPHPGPATARPPMRRCRRRGARSRR